MDNRQQASELITLRQFGAMSEALLAQGCLASAGIETFLADENMTRIDWRLTRGINLQVSSEDAEDAIALLEQPAADDPGA